MIWFDWLRKCNRKSLWVSFWDSAGLHAEDEVARIDIPWEQVREVHAYKKDLYAYDQIRVRFSGTEHVIEITEEQAAFGGLIRSMEENLGISADWWSEMMGSQSFRLNLTCLYSEGKARTPKNEKDDTK